MLPKPLPHALFLLVRHVQGFARQGLVHSPHAQLAPPTNGGQCHLRLAAGPCIGGEELLLGDDGAAEVQRIAFIRLEVSEAQ
jgi:hypothetical protein